MTERIGQCKGDRAGGGIRGLVLKLRAVSGLPFLWASLVVGAVGGCTVGPNFVPPAPVQSAKIWPVQPVVQAGVGTPPMSVPASVTVPDRVDPNWWTLLDDPELTSLEQRLAGGNLSLQVYVQRFEQSRAQLGVARADALPTLQADGSYTRERTSAKGVVSLFSGGNSGGSFGSQGSVASGTGGTAGGIPSPSAIQPFNLFQYGFDASWEVDLWGHARREVESAKADLAGAREQERNTLVSAEAEVARDYIQVRGLQQRIAITEADLKDFETTLHLTKERARAGLTTSLDVANSSALLEGARADLPQLRVQQAQALDALCLLLGEMPGSLDEELSVSRAVPLVPPVVPVGLPSDLARRRPDVRAAEDQLHSATAAIGVAVADFFPKVTLTGSIGIQALLAKDLGNWGARQYGFGPSVTIPIFEGGKLRATLELRRAQQREAAINYRQTVLQAFSDVNDALTAYREDQLRRNGLAAAVAASRQATVLAQQRYVQGIASFIDVLTAQRTQFQDEQQLTDGTTTVATDLVALYKALGGGWSEG